MPFKQRTVKLASNIIEKTHSPMGGYLLHHGINQGKGIKLLFTSGPHIGNEEGMIMTA
jgi:hypothetical protein